MLRIGKHIGSSFEIEQAMIVRYLEPQIVGQRRWIRIANNGRINRSESNFFVCNFFLVASDSRDIVNVKTLCARSEIEIKILTIELFKRGPLMDPILALIQ